jgi:hypothetical protein
MQSLFYQTPEVYHIPHRPDDGGSKHLRYVRSVSTRLHRATPPKPNVVVDWSVLLLRIPEVQASSLGQETGYPDRDFS